MNWIWVTGVVNRGDSFRRRRSRSNSLAPQHECSTSSDAGKSRTGTSAANNGIGGGGGGGGGGGILTGGDYAASTGIADHRGPYQHHSDVRTYRVALIGAHGVGKSALVGQFMSSECINAYDRVRNGITKQFY